MRTNGLNEAVFDYQADGLALGDTETSFRLTNDGGMDVFMWGKAKGKKKMRGYAHFSKQDLADLKKYLAK